MSQVEKAWRDTGLSVLDLWISYVALGGTRSPLELEAALSTALAAGSDDPVLAQTINERLADMGSAHHVPYLGDSRVPRAGDGIVING